MPIEREFSRRINVICPVQSLSAKIFCSFRPKSLHISRRPVPHRGAYRDRHGRGAGCGGREAALLTRGADCGRRSRVVLTPRRWRQVGERDFAEATVTNKARSPGRARRKPLKPLRAGMPGDSGATVVTNARAFYTTTRGCGCNGHPAFPAPSCSGRNVHAQPGRIAPRDCEGVSDVIASQRVARMRAR